MHRTYLRPDGGGKADVEPAKAMLGAVAGGAVRLAAGAEGAASPLVVAEGIETTLSLASGLLSGPAAIWASLSASNLRRLRLPACPGRLTIAAEGDKVGRDAARDLARRAAGEGWEVFLLVAPDDQDWNDVLTSAGREVAV